LNEQTYDDKPECLAVDPMPLVGVIDIVSMSIKPHIAVVCTAGGDVVTV